MKIKAPASKSYAQRAVAAALLSQGQTILRGVDLSDDTRAAIDVAWRLGAKVSLREEGANEYIIEGGLNPLSGEINIGESGLSTRLFTPIASLCSSAITITGHGSILGRPMGLMIEPLEALGVRVKSNQGFLPIEVCGPIKGGRTIEVDGSLSSQFLTGLLMALPLVEGDTTLVVKELQSKPYIDVTLSVLSDFGISVIHNNYNEFFIQGSQRYRPCDYQVEGDWSGASCLLVLKAISHGDFSIENLNATSVQADRAIEQAIDRAGSRLEGFDFDATHCPDLFPALVALAAHCKGESRFLGTSRLTHKESNRAVTLRQEFGKLGVMVDISRDNVMLVRGSAIDSNVQIDAHGDHRIAMATAVAGWDRSVEVLDRSVVNKSYPQFWSDLSSICAFLRRK